MNRMLWGWLIAAGMLLARVGFVELESGDGALPEIAVLLLLTGGLLAALVGITGLLGMLSWMPSPRRE